MYKCITCGTELHPERAKKYNYCMSPACQEKNAKGLTMVAVGVNKAAEQYLILDDQTKDELASGKYHDQRRGSFGTSPASAAQAPAPAAPAASPARPEGETSGQPSAHQPQAARRPQRAARQAQPAVRRPQPQPWTPSQQRLAILYNEQGLRPDEIAQKLGLSRYLVTQIILNSRTRGRL